MESTHNLAGLPLAERASLELESSLESARARWLQIEQAIERAPAEITTETVAENFTTVVAQIQQLIKRIDAAHDDVKEPYLVAGRKVDSVTNAFKDKVVEARDRLQQAITAYQVAKHERIEKERAALAAAERSDPEPSWTAPEPSTRRRTRVRSVEGASAHLVDTTDIRIVDVRQIPDRYLQRPKVLAALRSEILPDVKKGDVVPGVEKITDLQTRVKA